MNKTPFILCGCWLLFASAALALSPAEARQQLNSGEKITFVDVRATPVFKQGHIPNAINIPASLVALKQLPPMGRVIVYDEGLGQQTASAAAAALNQKTGITAEVLDGGFAAWESSQSLTTQSSGMNAEQLPMITYDRLKKTSTADLVLVDLRKSSAATAASAKTVQSTQGLTDLQAEFPNARISHSPFEASSAKKISAADAAKPPLLVLIDSGDGTAQETARALKANGITRFAILAGGEEILARKGQPGLQRAGSTVVLRQPK